MFSQIGGEENSPVMPYVIGTGVGRAPNLNDEIDSDILIHVR